ncbi:hypothetical protein Q7Z28_00610 [Glaesserella parasuis]|uniref:hypothetical protein n=1 Tax=Glaesserella parasuis TaxID=738 RepID=UPI0005C503E6|nr:hypothetical protein [Glaesserella parasuis]ATW43345.1 hypothetical protein A2U20_05820 [Glaesserella parasuis D74]MDP0316694.1 hypothetical protein [Glaesserella parasuis]
MGLKLSKELYKNKGIVYQEIYVNYPIYVFDTDFHAQVHGVLLWDGVNILAVPSYIFETFKKLEN